MAAKHIDMQLQGQTLCFGNNLDLGLGQYTVEDLDSLALTAALGNNANSSALVFVGVVNDWVVEKATIQVLDQEKTYCAQRLKNKLHDFARTLVSTVEAQKQCVTKSGVIYAGPKLSSFIPISEDAEKCNNSAIKQLKKQLRDVASLPPPVLSFLQIPSLFLALCSAALARWKVTIHAGGLSPGIVETEKTSCPLERMQIGSPGPPLTKISSWPRGYQNVGLEHQIGSEGQAPVAKKFI
ncbi:hypothetical protein EV421DRAFT_1743182 [Armillaria borealis]|uniref:Uncharacterized protein n=1 Tax=Armillaria borealis TaxID=47425 RepID=A0AA39IVP8_9AGAR|nr:hypothetical protein EV421DRAFT_1743182 [Armillaria borealis]